MPSWATGIIEDCVEKLPTDPIEEHSLPPRRSDRADRRDSALRLGGCQAVLDDPLDAVRGVGTTTAADGLLSTRPGWSTRLRARPAPGGSGRLARDAASGVGGAGGQ